MGIAPEKCYTIDASILSPPSPSSSGTNKTILLNETSTSSLKDTTSRLLCSCEKFLKEGNVHSKSATTSMNVQPRNHINIINTKQLSHRIPLNSNTVEKRLILTRNAATSPNLDLRKLSSMTTISASGSTIKSHKNLNELKSTHENGDAPNYKNTLEKSKSLSENKSNKLLRTTRSLSPRPQIQHQHAIIVSEASDDDEELKAGRNTVQTLQYHGTHCSSSILNIVNNSEQMTLRHRKPQKTCRSEQSSPNVSDNLYLKFEYSQLTNHSTDCLTYVPTDPWLQMTRANSGSSNIKRKPLINSNSKPMSNILLENQLDPWIRRNDMPTTSKTAEQESLRQANTTNVSKYFSRINETKNITMLQHCNVPIQATHDKCMSRIAIDKPLQSAPTSPQLPITSDNSFSSVCCFNNNPSEIQDKWEKRKYKGSNNEMPIRSSSFSPIRGRNFCNPFLNFHTATNRSILSTTPLISIASDSKTFNNRSGDIQFPNHSKFKIPAPSSNLLQDRHCFSSFLKADNWLDEELQLNMRRLSDQMLRKNDCDGGIIYDDAIQTSSIKNACPSNIKSFYSDRNINQGCDDQQPSSMVYENCLKKSNNVNASTEKLNRADISKYLKLFRGNETKKVERKLKNTYINNNSSTFDQIVNENHIAKSADTLLETTC